jgi:hypothetical protein
MTTDAEVAGWAADDADTETILVTVRSAQQACARFAAVRAAAAARGDGHPVTRLRLDTVMSDPGVPPQLLLTLELGAGMRLSSRLLTLEDLLPGYGSRFYAPADLYTELTGRVMEVAGQMTTAAPPVPGVTRVNSLFTVTSVITAGPGAWYVAAEQGDDAHFATWHAVAGGDGQLSYDGGSLFGSEEAALADLPRRAGVTE